MIVLSIARTSPTSTLLPLGAVTAMYAGLPTFSLNVNVMAVGAAPKVAPSAGSDPTSDACADAGPDPMRSRAKLRRATRRTTLRTTSILPQGHNQGDRRHHESATAEPPTGVVGVDSCVGVLLAAALLLPACSVDRLRPE